MKRRRKSKNTYIDRWAKSLVTIEEGWYHCFKKRWYHPETVNEVLNRRRREAGIELYSYQCRICGKWHLTKRKA